MTQYAAGGQYHPDDIIGIADANHNINDGHADPLVNANVGKPGKKTKGANDKTQKAKATPKPIEPEYAGWTVTLFEKLTDPKASWIKTKKEKLPFASNDLYDRAIRHHKATGVSAIGHYANLNKSQQAIVERLRAELNGSEKAPNAVWILFDVKKLHVKVNSMLRSNQINHAMRVIFKRQDLEAGTVKPKILQEYDQGDDVIDLSKPPKAAKAPAKKDGKAGKTGKTGKAGDNAQQEDPMNVGPFPGVLQQPIRVDSFDPADPLVVPPPQGQQQGPDPFFNNQQGPPPGAIPIPPQFQGPAFDLPPVAPEAPPFGGGGGHPFAPYRGVHPQPQPVPPHFEDRLPREHSMHREPLPSARRRSQSRHPSEENYTHRRRQSSDNDEKFRNFRDAMEEKIDGIAHAINVAAANNKIREWPVSTPYPSGSSHSSPRDDGWSHGSSSDRRGTPATSPDRSYRGRRSNSMNRERDRRNSSGRPFYDTGRRYYPEKDRVIRPHDSRREHGPSRDRRYQLVDDYPPQPPREIRYIQQERPRVVRHLTDFPEAYRHQANFADGRRQSRDIDYMRVPVDREDRHRDRVFNDDRRGGRDRRQLYYG